MDKKVMIDRFLGIPLLWCIKNKRDATIVKKIKNIAIIKLSGIGDTILLLPCIKQLKKKFPESKITVIGSKRNEEILRTIKEIDKISILDFDQILRKPTIFFNFIKEQKNTPYDLLIDASQWDRLTAIVSAKIPANKKIGFVSENQFRERPYDIKVPLRFDQHMEESFFDLVETLGVTKERTKRERKEEKKKEKLIIIHPGCGKHNQAKEWSECHYSELIIKIKKELPELQIILTGSKNEEMKCNRINEGAMQKATNKAGEFSLKELSNLLLKAKLLICGNTGVMHVASESNTPTIALHGCVKAEVWGPLNKRAQIIQAACQGPAINFGFENGCQKKCIDTISVERCWNEAEKILKRK